MPRAATAAPPATTAPDDADVELRPLGPEHAVDVRRIFRATLALGQPAGLQPEDLLGYEDLCLDWYLDHGRGVVVVQGGRVHGYLLACLDEADHRRWLRRRAGVFAAGAVAALVSGRLRGRARRFVMLRLWDGWTTLRHAPPPVFPAHAHINLAPGFRAAGLGHRLAGAMDALVASAGLPGWYGEMNVPRGRSLAAVTRAGASVVHRQPSRTFSWLAGRPVDRATLARPLRSRAATPPALVGRSR